ncbi:hypothetical protein K490DRAFT_59664 [Saccharata proteae CBS 121410]|uniref:Uncharacterized protein n=1 Tax=Saccharata proteae CBS 121410 TaxID=1314787 RepID=A0A9P4HRP9_9PEZI|nr:hypothetical protein K490DRAFT_59664 [Saccharata proteae CBS 121410]
MQQRLDNQQEHLHRSLEAAANETNRLRVSLQQEKNTRHEAQRGLFEAQNKVEDIKADIQSLQLADRRKQSQEAWFSQEDSIVRDNIFQLFRDVRNWSKAYGVKSLANVTRPPSNKLPAWAHDLARETSSSLRLPYEDVQARIMLIQHPYVILCALLSKHMQAKIFGNSFFALSNFDAAWNREEVGAFENMFRHTKNMANDALANNKNGQIWRSDTMRLLFSRSSAGSGTERQWSDEANRTIMETSHKVAADFMTGPNSTLLRNLSLEETVIRDSEILAIFRRAAFVFCELQAERVHFKWHPAQDILGSVFEVTSGFLEADRLYKLEDDQDHSHDGKVVGLALTPLVTAHGNPDAEDYDRMRVISKAIVWLFGEATEEGNPGAQSRQMRIRNEHPTSAQGHPHLLPSPVPPMPPMPNFD